MITESRERDQDVRLALAGELDLASRAPLQARLGQVGHAGVSLRLDLSRLDFIDSSGLHAIIDASQAAQRDGWRLEIEPSLRTPVRRAIEIVNVDQLLWPSAQHTNPGP